MKKDKAWLKEEVKSLFDEAYDSGKMEYHESEESIHRINNLVDQLDEPETLSEEWINEHSKAYTMENSVEISDLKNLLLPQPKKPVIPKFVADFIKVRKHNDAYSLQYIFCVAVEHSESDKFKKEYDWARENDELFARAWLDGYEVEKEKKYYVLDKKDATLLKKRATGERVSKSAGANIYNVKSWECEEEYQLTEQEIKNYDERYWAFAEEVTE